MSGVGVEAPPQTGSEAGHERSAWDWTDVLLSVPLTVLLGSVLGFGLVAVIVPFIPAHDQELRTAVAKFLVQFSLYAGVVASVVGLVSLRRHASLRTLGWRPVATRWLLGAVPLALAAYVLVVIAGLVGNSLFPQAHNGQPKAVRDAFGHYQLLAVVAVSLIAPFAEETLFRGFLFGWLRGRIPLWAALALSALVFSLAHGEVALLVPIFVLGCLLALVYERSGSLIPGMVIHAIFNLIG
ncbi:MAG: lysostaphin resistance A-like protein, partial [Candidatus Dormibacteria bacterium]